MSSFLVYVLEYLQLQLHSEDREHCGYHKTHKRLAFSGDQNVTHESNPQLEITVTSATHLYLEAESFQSERPLDLTHVSQPTHTHKQALTLAHMHPLTQASDLVQLYIQT